RDRGAELRERKVVRAQVTEGATRGARVRDRGAQLVDLLGRQRGTPDRRVRHVGAAPRSRAAYRARRGVLVRSVEVMARLLRVREVVPHHGTAIVRAAAGSTGRPGSPASTGTRSAPVTIESIVYWPTTNGISTSCAGVHCAASAAHVPSAI